MLSIPQAIKDRFKTDGVLKNVRITFPNGEREDICNDRLVKESVKFDESISSREEVRFGLCESSTLSFQCTDVGNIKGMEIAAFIEIDATDVEPVEEYGCTENKPVAFMIRPSGETEDLIFIICDFPYREAGAADYTAEDGTDISWTYTDGSGGYPAGLVRNRVQNRSMSLDDYRQLAGVDPRGTYEDMYDGYHGGGYERTYLFSVKTGKFYKCVRVDYFPYNDYVDLRGVLAEGFTNDVWFDALGQIEWDDTRGKYIWHWDADIHTSSDVPFPFYRVPLGYFVVDEAKRDAKMRMRKVTAYSRMSSLPAYDWWTILTWPVTSEPLGDKTLNFNVMNFILSSNRGMFSIPDDAATPLSGWQEYRLITSGQDAFSRERQFTSATSGHTYNVTFTVSKYSAYGLEISALGRNYGKKPWGELSRLLRLDEYTLSSQYESSLADLDAYLVAHQITEEDVRTQIREYVEWFSRFNPVSMYVCDYFYLSSEFLDSVESAGRPLKVGDMFMAPYYLIAFMSMRVSVSSGSDVLIRFLDSIDDVTVSEINLDYNTYTIPIQPEITAIDEAEPITWAYYSFLQTVMFLNSRDLLEGCVELRGCFGRMNRYGYFQFLSLYHAEIEGLFPDPSLFPTPTLLPVGAGDTPEETDYMAVVGEDDMISMWYEEYFIAYGGITCTYLSTEVLDENNNPVEVTYENVWANDQRMLMYDVSDNAVIKGNKYTAAQITALLAPLVTALQGFKFYPSDLQCVGLPYIEAGDWVLASMYGNTVLNLCLSRTLSGIQALRDKMKSD